VSKEEPEAEQGPVGLCAHCRFMRLVQSDRRSTFYFCSLSATDAAFPKYPRLPVLQCRGLEPSTAGDSSIRD